MQQNPEKAASVTSKDTHLQLGHNNWTHWPTPEIHICIPQLSEEKPTQKQPLGFTHSTDIYRQLHIDQVNSLLTRRRLQYLGKNCEHPQFPWQQWKLLFEQWGYLQNSWTEQSIYTSRHYREMGATLTSRNKNTIPNKYFHK